MSAKQCPVCMEKYTRVIRQPIECAYCPESACRKCTSQYLLTTPNDPHCMHCKREWNREFIDLKLTKTFRKGPLKEHRRKVLMDRERSRLPAMQVYVEAHHTIQEENRNLSQLYLRKLELKRQKRKVQVDHAAEGADALIRALEPIRLELRKVREALAECEKKRNEAHMILSGGEVKSVREFVMKCPADDCRGFLSSAWKCGTCQQHFCSDCHAQKASHDDNAHVCNEDAKATASMIRKETRACPKCGIRIFKLEGCNQMFCTSCHTTFDWASGRVLLNTVIHNPHYYEYLRQKNNGVVPRELGDVPCGGLPDAYLFVRCLMASPEIEIEMIQRTTTMLRCLNDLQHVRLPQFPIRQPANVNQDIDIRYLMKTIDEDTWGRLLERTETKFEQRKEMGLILQTLIHVAAEKLTSIQNAPHSRRGRMIKTIYQEIEDVRVYTNKSLIEKGNQMGVVVPQISDDWYWRWALKSEMKKVVKEEGGEEEKEEGMEEVDGATIEPAQVAVEENVFVDVGGEMIEMSVVQAREIFGV